MSFTGMDLPGRSIGKADAWLAGIDAGLDTSDRWLAYCVLQARLPACRTAWPGGTCRGVVAQAFDLLPADVRELLEPGAGEPAAAGASASRPAAGGRG